MGARGRHYPPRLHLRVPSRPLLRLEPFKLEDLKREAWKREGMDAASRHRGLVECGPTPRGFTLTLTLKLETSTPENQTTKQALPMDLSALEVGTTSQHIVIKSSFHLP